MSHLSDLILDELLAGLPVPPEAQEHLARCLRCGERRSALERLRVQTLESPEAQFLPTRLLAETPRRERNWLRWIAPVAAVCLASLTLVLLPTRQTVRLKGTPAVELLRAPGAQGPLHPGEPVTLALGAAGHPYALVFSRAADGTVERLWPENGDRSGRTHDGTRAPLASLSITPGDFDLIAVLSDSPLSSQAVADAIAHHAGPEGAAARVEQHVVVKGGAGR